MSGCNVKGSAVALGGSHSVRRIHVVAGSSTSRMRGIAVLLKYLVSLDEQHWRCFSFAYLSLTHRPGRPRPGVIRLSTCNRAC